MEDGEGFRSGCLPSNSTPWAASLRNRPNEPRIPGRAPNRWVEVGKLKEVAERFFSNAPNLQVVREGGEDLCRFKMLEELTLPRRMANLVEARLVILVRTVLSNPNFAWPRVVTFPRG